MLRTSSRFCALVVLMSLAAAMPASAQQDYPSRSIRLVVSASQGGITDVLAPVAARVHQEIQKLFAQPDVRERIFADGAEPVASSPEEFRKFLLADLAKWAKLVKESGARLD